MLVNSANLDGCNNVQSPYVTLDISAPLSADVSYPNSFGQSPSVTDGGFSLQLNAAAPATGSFPATWLQYALSVNNGEVTGVVEYWNGVNLVYPTATSGPIITLPKGTNTLPALSNLEIALETDPASGVVTDVIFTASTPAGGNTVWLPLPSDWLIPIAGFQVDLVGPGNYSQSKFTSGSANITYGVSTYGGGLCLLTNQPSCMTEGDGTGESSNVVYGTINPCCGSQMRQSISFSD
jgi:hypothetical protein